MLCEHSPSDRNLHFLLNITRFYDFFRNGTWIYCSLKPLCLSSRILQDVTAIFCEICSHKSSILRERYSSRLFNSTMRTCQIESKNAMFIIVRPWFAKIFLTSQIYKYLLSAKPKIGKPREKHVILYFDFSQSFAETIR